MSFNFKSKKGLKIGYHRIGFGLNNALERHKLEGNKLERHKLERHKQEQTQPRMGHKLDKHKLEPTNLEWDKNKKT